MKDRKEKRESMWDILESWGLWRSSAKNAPARKDGLKVVFRDSEGDSQTVGWLTQEGEDFVFRYADEYLPNGRPLPGFPDLGKEYRERELWPFFAVRLPSTDRADVKKLIETRGIDPADTLRMLQELGRRTITGPYELEPAPAK